MDIRKSAIIIVITVLFSIFAYTLVEAIHAPPEYNDFCKDRPMPKPINNNCSDPERIYCDVGYPAYEIENGCQVNPYCETCNVDFDKAKDKYSFFFFIASSLIGLLALIIGFILPKKSIHDYIGSGLIYGAIITIFIGTIRYFPQMSRILKPIVILIELIIVIIISYLRFKK